MDNAVLAAMRAPAPTVAGRKAIVNLAQVVQQVTNAKRVNAASFDHCVPLVPSRSRRLHRAAVSRDLALSAIYARMECAACHRHCNNARTDRRPSPMSSATLTSNALLAIVVSRTCAASLHVNVPMEWNRSLRRPSARRHNHARRNIRA